MYQSNVLTKNNSLRLSDHGYSFSSFILSRFVKRPIKDVIECTNLVDDLLTVKNDQDACLRFRGIARDSLLVPRCFARCRRSTFSLTPLSPTRIKNI